MKFVYFFKSYEDNDGLLYDAFVSYVSRPEDEEFVYTHLRPKLEQEMGFRLCLHKRDFVIGDTISNNICDTLENTRRFILVLTPRYLESEWAEFEYQKASQEMLKLNIRIVPIILEEITATTTINHTLKAILESVTYITYPGSQASQQQLDKFWERVHLSMRKMKNKKASPDQVESFKFIKEI
ncbi:toll-like receptor 13 [Littorina saxatilis]|uniref:toll-like receptor 13 n=1 Tax=Littorina saxatilis TaxID=31220 RepID=UPI0038B69A5F